MYTKQLLEGTIEENVQIAKQIYKIIIRLKANEKIDLMPGQFVMLSCPGKEQVYLKRPFSVSWFDGKFLHILYRVLGKGTLNLSCMQKGQDLDFVAPCGNSFHLPQHGRILLLAGGLGVAPLSYLATQIRELRKELEIFFYYGTSCIEDRIIFPGLENSDIHFFHHSDSMDGIYNEHLFSFFSRHFHEEGITQAYTCGPTLLMKSMAEWCESNNIALQVSLEKHMGCGIGSCLACSIKTTDGMKTVCHDGPVFDSKIIDWTRQ